MGTLVAWHYPTVLFAKLADHTYVACGNGGRAWSCWGGKTGGSALRSGTGSTLRADFIAEPDEKANIRCYLVNGVCHQAANRILFPAGITVRGAKGYWISEALYGTYGRPAGPFGTCKAPFHQHNGVTGELPACETGDGVSESAMEAAEVGEPSGMERYLARVRSQYEIGEQEALETAAAPMDAQPEESFQLSLFELMVDYKLDEGFKATTEGREAVEVRVNVEVQRRELEGEFFTGEMPVEVFVERYNDLIERYQENTAETLREENYRALFDEPRGDVVTLGDPRVALEAYGGKTYGGE